MGLAFDASSLIILQELGLLRDVVRLGVGLVTTDEVLREVQSPTVHALVPTGDLELVHARIAAISSTLRLGLGPGEASILAFVAENPSFWAVLDEKAARQVARDLGFRFLGTARLVKHLADKGLMSADRARAILESLPRIGFFIEPETIREVLGEKPIEL